jgi:hypothetical protein
MRFRLQLGTRDLDAPLLSSRRSGCSMVASDIRGGGPFTFGGPHHRTLDVYGHPQYRLRRVA